MRAARLPPRRPALLLVGVVVSRHCRQLPFTDFVGAVTPAATDLATAELAFAFALPSVEACAAPARPDALGPRPDVPGPNLLADSAGAVIPAATALATAESAFAFALPCVEACAAPARPAALGPRPAASCPTVS